jgi:hypothetical protein
MKFFFTIVSLTIAFYTSAQRCGTPEYIQSHPAKRNITQRTESQKVSSRDTLTDEVIIIPVVVHVLYNTAAQNISDEQILSQINSLNKDFRRQNADTANTPEPFKKVAADVRIQFCLAKVNPQGYSTTGIVRKYTKKEFFENDDKMKFSAQGGDDACKQTFLKKIPKALIVCPVAVFMNPLFTGINEIPTATPLIKISENRVC